MFEKSQSDSYFHKKISFQRGESIESSYSKENPIHKKNNQSFLSFAYSYLQFTWATKWIYLGSRKPLPAKILPNLPESDSTNYWSNLFESSVEQERLKSLSSFDRKILVIRALWKCLYGQFIMIIVLKVLWEVCLYLNNSIIRGFIQYKEMENSAEISGIKNEKVQALGVGFRHALLLVFFHAAHVYISTQFNFWESRVVLKIQTCLKTSIFKRLIESNSCAKNLLQNGKEIVKSKIQEDDLEIPDDVCLDIDYDFSNQNPKCQNDKIHENEEIIDINHTGKKKGSEDRHNISTNVFNLLMVDVEDIEEFIMALIHFILLPFRIFVASLLMYRNIGESAIPGVVVMISMIIFMIVLDVISALLKDPLLYWRDRRLAKLHEVLSKVRAIKILGWAPFAEEIVLRDRKSEISYLYRIISLSSLSYLFFKLAISGSVVAIMVYYTKGMLNKAGNLSSASLHQEGFDLKASNIIPLIHVINYVAGILRTVPSSLNMLIEGWISLKRFSNHLGYSHIPSNTDNKKLAEDYLSQSNTNICKSDISNESEVERRQKHEETPLISKILTFDGKNMLEVNDITSEKNEVDLDIQVYKPNEDQETADFVLDKSILVYLQDLKYVSESENERSRTMKSDFKLMIPKMVIKKNSCHLIIGNSGSGKSTLLYGILGEVNFKQGLRFIRSQNNTIGFCSEDPWIPIGTVRSVILFERPWNEKRYNRVVEACLLIEDFMQWQEGDLRVLDDGGHILSGGQRSRLTLARALYGFFSDFDEYNRLDEADLVRNSHYGVYCSHDRSLSRFDTQLFLFDDIFVSLDPNVGRRIFYNLFNRNDGLLTGGNYSTVIVINPTVLLCFLDGKLSQEEINEKFGVEINIWNIKSESGGSNLNTLEQSKYDVLKKIGKERENSFRYSGMSSELSDYKNVISQQVNDEKPKMKNINFIDERGTTNFKIENRKTSLTKSNNKAASYTSSDFYNEEIVCVQSESGQRSISFSLYGWYLSKVGIFLFFFIICPLIMLSIILDNSQDFLLVEWTGFTSDGKDLKSDVEFYGSNPGSKNTLESHRNYMYGLIIIFVVGMLTHLLVQAAQILASMGAAKKIHNEMLRGLLSTSQEFFDRNTIGQIINRFCLDMISIDRKIMFKICSFVSIVLEIIIRGGFIVFVFPWLLLMIPPICLFAWLWLFQYYRHTARELFRSNLSAHTPVCNIYTQALMGGSIIRAFRCEDVFLSRNINYIDDLQKVKFMKSGSDQWISVRMQLLMLPFTAGITLVPIVLNYLNISTSYFASFSIIKITAGSWGLALVYAMSYAPLVNDSFNMFTTVEKSMCAVERISVLLKDLTGSKEKEFNEQLHESKYRDYIKSNNISPQNAFKGLYIHELRVEYGGQSLGIELKNEYIKYGECIGIIGRTGSGKTTFLNSLLGLTPINTSLLFLDGTWLFNKRMRQNKNEYIGVLPQNSIGFDGWTIRKFLDPFEEIHNDQLIWDGINACGLENTLRSLNSSNPLETVLRNTAGDISERRGSNSNKDCKFTQKHLRQLALARLIIHRFKYKIILVDEPPEELSGNLQNQNSSNSYLSMNSSNEKSLNNTSDSQYLSVEEIVSKFMKHCIVFIVAHNYKSLKSCDRIWVLSGGKKVNECKFSQINNQQMLADFLFSNGKNF
ncbi:ATP-binding cassette protein 2 [Cryptosporidium ubiquitum]|uniref:ATP-binding cassette protein 2 n=1 Tax=Cryptosporidium ubiquitum TaxID=857276 RepID=A0A1J4MFU8_9CRYT|nr:ATP-binding cassette protein 2 [Cryptosporidium ubiquitum]OII72879.1 ATP-binding cassette protein 2 [Cryptosporidium ubiquitum]